MKKIFIIGILIIMVLCLFNSYTYATVEPNDIGDNTTSKVLEMNEEQKTEKDKYVERYGSESYGMVAYILHKIQIYSIPLCFVGIAVGALYQYVLGTRRLDMKHKGFGLIISFVTILVICQVLPLAYTVVVKGWRG